MSAPTTTRRLLALLLDTAQSFRAQAGDCRGSLPRARFEERLGLQRKIERLERWASELERAAQRVEARRAEEAPA